MTAHALQRLRDRCGVAAGWNDVKRAQAACAARTAHLRRIMLDGAELYRVEVCGVQVLAVYRRRDDVLVTFMLDTAREEAPRMSLGERLEMRGRRGKFLRHGRGDR